MSEAELVTLSRFRADLGRALSRRGKTLLEAADLPAAVAALSPVEAYFMVKELGLEDALPLVRAATDEQFRLFVDLDCWRDDLPDPVELDAWLATFAREGRMTVAEAFDRLDEELQILFLNAGLRIYEASDEELPPPAPGVPRMTTPDRLFVLDAVVADRWEVDLFALCEALYDRDPREAHRLLVACRWELSSTLEEQALRWRTGRLADLGFPPADQARRIFARPPSAPPAATPTPPATTLPAIYAAPLRAGTLFSDALARLDGEELTTAYADLVYLINAAVVAFGESPRDLAHVTAIAERVRDTVSLGLETLAAREPDDQPLAARAATLLHRWPVRLLFAHGHHATLPLADQARALAARPEVAAWLQQPETERTDYGAERADRELMRALLGPTPLEAGFDPLLPARRRAFAGSAQLDAARQRLDELAARFA